MLTMMTSEQTLTGDTMDDIRTQIEDSVEQDSTLAEAKERVETLLRQLIAQHEIYDYAVASLNPTQLDVAVKPSSEEHFVYIPIWLNNG